MSTTHISALLIAVVLGITTGTPAIAGTDTKSSEQSDQTPVYIPPKRGAPVTRSAGGTRGIGTEQIYLTVLAPEHTGWTHQAQPVLYWYISAPTDIERELVLYDGVSVEPLLITRRSGPIAAGVHALSLADHDIQLQPNVEYEWSVSLIIDPEQPSNNLVTSGTVTYVKAPSSLTAQVANSPPTVAAGVYASQGYWYDAMARLSGHLDKQLNDPLPRQYRSALLKQVALSKVTDHDPP